LAMLRARPSSPERVTLLLGDRQLHLPAWVAPAVQRVLEVPVGETFTSDQLRDLLDATSRRVLLARLVREGLIRITG
jgi:hypothetical protein